MSKKGVSVGWFVMIGMALILVVLVLAFIYQTNKIDIGRSVRSVDEKPSFSTYVESSYEVAADCFLKRLALNDAGLVFANTRPAAILADGDGFIEAVIDEVFQNFTVFKGRNIQKEKCNPKIMLKDSSVDVEVSQKFSIKVDQQDHRISQFLTTIPLPFKRMLNLRSKAAQGKDTELNLYYNQGLDVAAYQKQEQTIISLDNKGNVKEELRFVFVKS